MPNWDDIAAFMTKSRQRLKSFAAKQSSKLTPEDCDDLVQDLSLELFKHGDKVNDIEAYANFLTPKRVIDKIRQKHREKVDNVDIDTLDVESEADIAASYITEEKWQRLHAALNTVEPKYRTIVEARYFEEKTFEAIAATENMPESTVRLYLDKGVLQLAERLHLVELSGVVIDDCEILLPAARVIARGTEPRKTDTDRHGAFSLKFESRGKFSLEISKAGYVTHHQVVNLNQDMALPNIKLSKAGFPGSEAKEKGA